MSVIYEWPEHQKFATAYACKYLPRTGSARLYNAFINPVFNLVPIFGNFTIAAISWLALGLIFYWVYEISPISTINSVDGQYTDLNTSLLYSFLFYYAASFIMVLVLYTRGCDALKEQARDYLYRAPKLIPKTLESSAYP